MSSYLITSLQMVMRMFERGVRFVWRIAWRCCDEEHETSNTTRSVAITLEERTESRRQFNFNMLARVIVYTDAETSKSLRLSCRAMNRFFNIYRIKEGISSDDDSVLLVDYLFVKIGGPNEKVFIAARPKDSYNYKAIFVEKSELYNHIWYIFSEDVKLDFLDIVDFLKFNQIYFKSFNRSIETILTFPLSFNSPDIRHILMELARPTNSSVSQRFHIVFGRTKFKSMFLSDREPKVSYFGNIIDAPVPDTQNGNTVIAFFQSNHEFFKDWMEAIIHNFDDSAVLLFDRTEIDDVHDLFSKITGRMQMLRAGSILLEEYGFLLRFHSLLTEEKKLLVFGSLKELTDDELDVLILRRMLGGIDDEDRFSDSDEEDRFSDSDEEDRFNDSDDEYSNESENDSLDDLPVSMD